MGLIDPGTDGNCHILPGLDYGAGDNLKNK
jgi:hypothetical protein